ncbi:hypothetical protein [Flavobacterium sp.]|uniref:hypothetical protein n=1 Tax=Flavobacterium sp. TaxID=239 RepID=UPI003D0C6692
MLLKQFKILSLFLCFPLLVLAQNTPYQRKKIKVTQDTIHLDTVSINASFFKLLDKNEVELDSTNYQVDFSKATLVLKNKALTTDSLTVRFLNFPDFLTKTYSVYDAKRLVNTTGSGVVYRAESNFGTQFKPFDGLTTSGSITRGVTIGNNQNASVNSNLDLQITGKLSDKVSIRASLQDNNIPLQQGGYSQRLDEFDQIFIELFADKWSIRGGDLFLENRKSRFLNFNKKVQGVSARLQLGNPERKTETLLAGAVVRGQYAKSTFTGQEGNQGPYKLRGPNGELYVLVISGSERVYVNGILLERGENNQYVIDYNAGEVTFTSLFPITSEMRIVIEYQFSERSYTRFVTYGGAQHENEKWSLGAYLYSENDSKNQPLQQNLSPEQVQVLAQAGDNPLLMNAPSATLEAYSDKKILYKKTTINGVLVYEYSANPQDELYNVRFSQVGKNKGNYIIKASVGNGRIYEYKAPVSGVLQGEYEPVIKLIAPTKLQIATLLGKFAPFKKTTVDFELGMSNSDQNLFSSLDDANNQGVAGKLNWKQQLFAKKWLVNASSDWQYVQAKYKTVERLFNIEFDRDWNLKNTRGNQSLLATHLTFELPKKSFWKYQYENLNFSESFSGNRHSVSGFIKTGKWQLHQQGSLMQSNGTEAISQFLRNQLQTKWHFRKNWIGGSQRLENNQEREKATQKLTSLSQRFSEWGAFMGRGDSTKVYAELGLLHRLNDSLQLGLLKRVNRSNSYYLKSKLIQNEKADLWVFVNYRQLTFEDARGAESSLNSRVLYNDRFFKQLVQWTTSYETASGTIPQQEFNFIEVEAGRGIYAWNDYNQNGIKELQEFEIAKFPDQAKYVKVFLPNQTFVKTHQNRFSQALILNPNIWINRKGTLKVLSHFYNQTSFLMERKVKRIGDNFDLNPFNQSVENLLGLTSSFKNSLYYNRGKQSHSVTYNFIQNDLKSLLLADELQNTNSTHQLLYTHLLKKSWLVNAQASVLSTRVSSLNYASRNYTIDGNELEFKLGYLFSKNASWDFFYEYQKKQNQIGENEFLHKSRLGTSFNVATEKRFTMSGEFAYVNNSFDGNPNSPVGFQMLEGLQINKNYTWRLLLQKNLTQYLDLNVNYQGRKSETSQVIHTGNVQLRAYF